MLPDSTQNLITKIWEMSERQAIPWRTDSSGARSFDTEGYRVQVQGAPARLAVLRVDGHPIEVATTDNLKRTAWPTTRFGNFADVVCKLAGVEPEAQIGPADTALPVIDTVAKATASNSTPTLNAAIHRPMFGEISAFASNKAKPPERTSSPAGNSSVPDKKPKLNIYSPWT